MCICCISGIHPICAYPGIQHVLAVYRVQALHIGDLPYIQGLYIALYYRYTVYIGLDTGYSLYTRDTAYVPYMGRT